MSFPASSRPPLATKTDFRPTRSYCYRCGNLASVMEVSEGGKTAFKTFDAAAENETDERNPASRRSVSHNDAIPSLLDDH